MRGLARISLGVVFALSLSMQAQAGDGADGHYVVSAENLNLLPKELKPLPLASQSGLHLVYMKEKQVEALAAAIHEVKFACGGFVTVDKEMMRATPQDVLAQMLARPRVAEEKVSVRYRNQVQAAMAEADQNRYERNLKNFTSFTNRNAKKAEGIKATEWLRDQMLRIAKENGRSDATAEFIATPKFNQSSVVIKLPGTQAGLPAVIVGGHMDTIQYKGFGEVDAANQPGVDDDASGSIGVMETFQAILEAKLKFKRDMYFIFYAAEEYGLHGSKAVVAEFKRRSLQARGVMQLDMIGYKSPKDQSPIFLTTDYTTASMNTFATQLLGTYMGVKDVGTLKCGYACSDHASWYQAGYPVVFPFEAGGGNHNKLIHTLEDTINVLDMAHAMKYVRLAVAFMVELGEPATGAKN
ncbi:MAG TPA: M20/M25/M40 family metallo-hydrolase [Bdellovibrionales bacterium]|nr:M20/M25/M40 family metallo-hydrolase [Bdellovibrionales bacterium]